MRMMACSFHTMVRTHTTHTCTCTQAVGEDRTVSGQDRTVHQVSTKEQNKSAAWLVCFSPMLLICLLFTIIEVTLMIKFDVMQYNMRGFVLMKGL